ncbi:hypothetical protein CDIK_4440, partial [Cucumispora dikerogammari]
NTYNLFLYYLNQLISELNPHVIMSDFETAAITAFSSAFPGARMTGCMFHLAQSVQRKLDSSGFSTEFKNTPNVRKFVQALKCLPFVPISETVATFEWLKQLEDFPQELISIFNYFETTYIGTFGLNPRFPIEFWNNRQNVLDTLPRTNNAVEGWHNVFRSSFGRLNKTPRNFVIHLIEEEEKIRQKHQRLMLGEALKLNKKYQRISENLHNFIIQKSEIEGKHAIDYFNELMGYIYY